MQGAVVAIPRERSAAAQLIEYHLWVYNELILPTLTFRPSAMTPISLRSNIPDWTPDPGGTGRPLSMQEDAARRVPRTLDNIEDDVELLRLWGVWVRCLEYNSCFIQF